MRATVFYDPENIRVEVVLRSHPAAGEAVIPITLTTKCHSKVRSRELAGNSRRD